MADIQAWGTVIAGSIAAATTVGMFYVNRREIRRAEAKQAVAAAAVQAAEQRRDALQVYDNLVDMLREEVDRMKADAAKRRDDEARLRERIDAQENRIAQLERLSRNFQRWKEGAEEYIADLQAALGDRPKPQPPPGWIFPQSEEPSRER